jgi:hypothetical protein
MSYKETMDESKLIDEEVNWTSIAKLFAIFFSPNKSFFAKDLFNDIGDGNRKVLRPLTQRNLGQIHCFELAELRNIIWVEVTLITSLSWSPKVVMISSKNVTSKV